MAYSLALRRGINSPSIFDLIRSSVSSASRCFNTNAQINPFHEEEPDTADDSPSRRRGMYTNLVSDEIIDPFANPQSASHLTNLINRMIENNSYLATSRGMGAGTGSRRAWDVREEENALHIRMDMPGVGKENVKISVEDNTLTIKGERERESEEEEYGGRYSSRIDLAPKLYKLDGIKAEMKNGVLKVVVPKFKEEERKDVYQVKIQ